MKNHLQQRQLTTYPVLKKAKQQKQLPFFKVDKLIKHGQVYREVETENLPYVGIL